MTNPINPINRSSIGSTSNQAEKSPAKGSAEGSAERPATSGDTVSLSRESQQVIELQQRLQNTPEIDRARVEAIKQEIAKGNYPLDSEKIAENLINIEQSLLE